MASYKDTTGKIISDTAFEAQKKAGNDVSGFSLVQDTTAPTQNKVVKPVGEANLTDPMALEQGTGMGTPRLRPEEKQKTISGTPEEITPATPEIKVDTTTTKGKKQDEIDFQDNSDKAMKGLIINLKALEKSNPNLFSDQAQFNKALSYGDRTDRQQTLLDTYFNSRKNLVDKQTSEIQLQQDSQKLLNNLSILTPEQLLTRGLSDDEKVLLQQGNPELYNQYVAKQSEKQKLAMINGTDKTETTNPFQAVIDNYMKNLQNFSTNSNLYTDYKNAINDESLKAEKNKIIDLQNQVDALNTEIQSVEDDVKKRYEGTGATSGKIARIVADEQKALYKKMQLLNDQLTSASNVYTNKINTINDEFDLKQKEDAYNLQQRNQQMSELGFAMNLMSYQTPEQQDERERNKFIRQEEYTNGNIYSSDPATRRKAIEKAVDNVLKEFDGIPMTRSREQMISDIQNMVDNGEELGTAITKNIREPIKDKAEYKLWSAKKLGVSDSALETAGMTFKRNDETKSRDVGGGTSTDSNGVDNSYTGMKGLGAKNNNPGNIKDTTFGNVIGTDDKGFAQFATPEDGFDALVEKIKYNQTNSKSKYYGKTIAEYFKLYAPSSDNNNPDAYAKSVASALGVNINTKISDVDATKFAAQIAKHDSGYDYSSYGKGGQVNAPTASELAYFDKGATGIDATGKKGLTKKRFDEIAKRKEANKSTEIAPLTDDQRVVYNNQLGSFRGNAQVKAFEDGMTQYYNIQDSLDNVSGPGDVAAIFQFMKALDPQSVVRESEFQVAAESAGVVAQIGNTYNKLLKGERLTDKQREAFGKLAKQFIINRGKSYDRLYDDFKRVTDNMGIDESYLPTRASSELYQVNVDVPNIPKVNYNINNSQSNAGSINNIVSGFYNY